MSMEIERKFLLKYLPEELKIDRRKTIFQSYLARGREEVRIRRITYDDSSSKFFLTYKNRIEGRLGREEIEIEITEPTYNQLNNKSVPVIKERLLIGLQDGHKAEVDLFQNIGFDLKTVEVEFNSVEEAEKFLPPDWFGRELTGRREYNNQELWEALNSGK